MTKMTTADANLPGEAVVSDSERPVLPRAVVSDRAEIQSSVARWVVV